MRVDTTIPSIANPFLTSPSTPLRLLFLFLLSFLLLVMVVLLLLSLRGGLLSLIQPQ